MPQRPNILFLMSDEHRADVTGYEGNRVIRTPLLDELARSGTVFRNAYTPSPVCVPGRQCMMSGQLPKTCQCEGWKDLPPNSMTFARRFAQYGYATVACGKLHHQGFDQMQGWTKRVGGDVETNVLENPVVEECKKYRNKLWNKWSNAQEVQRAGVARGPYQVFDEYALTGALDFIESYFKDPHYGRVQSDRPLLLKTSFLQPHYPFCTSAEKFEYYLNRVEPYLNQEPSRHPILGLGQVKPGVDASELEIRNATAAYYGMIDTVDGYFGKIMQALKDVGQDLDDWIIVYTSDHGDMLGEHGVWEKTKFYEASARVPLIIRAPKYFSGGKVVQQNVNLCDLFATLCDLAELPTPSGLDSRSLLPLLRGEAKGWKNETISQFYRPKLESLMIKHDHLKYQYYGAQMPEVLFDLQKDPGEKRDFIDDPSYTKELAVFRRRRDELGHGPGANSNYKNAGY